jgi:putative tryptophan/tyrosine transport system substrate-binding protein
MNNRREFITLLGGAAAAWPFAAQAQQPAMPVIGFLSSRSPAESANLMAGFRKGLVEGDDRKDGNVAVEYRWAEGAFDRLPTLSSDLVARQVAVIVAVGNTVSAVAAKAATTRIPIVFVIGDDPVKVGLVASLNRPGGNITGVSVLGTALEAKRMELLRELIPKTSTIAFLLNANSPNKEHVVAEVQAAARTLGQEVVIVQAGTASEFESAFASLSKQRASALAVQGDPLFSIAREQLITLAAYYAVPAIYQWREFVHAGGLISYGTNLADAYRIAGVYAGRIINGAKPAELPVQQPTKFELVINLKTAKALGLQIPDKLLALADEAIE